MLNKLAATVVTGFLGSGKTTLLRHVLQHAGGRRIAVLVNEFGELGIDGELLRCPLDCPEDDPSGGVAPVYELANGCICCTVQEEFFPVMRELVNRREQLDHILIETSGLALPKPLVQAFNWPEIKAHCSVNAVITVVDGPAVAAGQFACDPGAVNQLRLADQNLDHEASLHELFEDQLGAADLVVLNKTDQLSRADKAMVYELLVDELPSGVKIVEAKHGNISAELMLGLDINVEDVIHMRRSHHDAEDHDHDHDAFQSVALMLAAMDKQTLLNICKTLVDEFPVLRLKGIAAIPGKAMRMVVQGVGHRFDAYYDRAWQNGEQQQTQLILIGRQLNEADVKNRLDELLNNTLNAPA